MIVVGQNQDVAVASPGELAWQHEEVRANGVQCGVEVHQGQAEPFEPVHQIVGEEQNALPIELLSCLVSIEFPCPFQDNREAVFGMFSRAYDSLKDPVQEGSIWDWNPACWRRCRS